MEQPTTRTKPHRIVDLVTFQEEGADVTCNTSFEVIPVDFQHRDNAYQAHVFMCYFRGMVNEEEYVFRKCYARGCSHNLCPHVSQAVMIANRYLQQDYRLLREAEIEVEERLFTLEDMVVKFEGYLDEHDPTLTIDDYLNIAREGNEVTVEIEPEYVPSVEHFGNYKNAQTFLTANFVITCLGKRHEVDRCFACYTSEKEKEDKTHMAQVANARLEQLYKAFDQASVRYEKRFFS